MLNGGTRDLIPLLADVPHAVEHNERFHLHSFACTAVQILFFNTEITILFLIPWAQLSFCGFN